ncbi:MerR family DNA-binding transcriptional regulator [Streptomyces erythrochromogenes]|uniref:MerR family DNA-binding transcriptional regulator n=1 Tax=Streptomyces erythrochromogenes TaxID=285574 RepID=UPI0038194E9A
MDTAAGARLLDIAEVAEATGVAPSALRYYERLGLLAPRWTRRAMTSMQAR